MNLIEGEPQRAALMRRSLERFIEEGAYQGERLSPTAANAFELKESKALGYDSKTDDD